MTKGRIEIPAAAIEALAKARHDRVLYENWDDIGDERRGWLLDEARRDLEAAYPHLLAACSKDQPAPSGGWPPRFYARFKKHPNLPWPISGGDEIVASALKFYEGQDDVEVARYVPAESEGER